MKLILATFFLFSGLQLSAQNCEVLNSDLKGKYEGDCKKGKAHGKGKAEGKDSYEGDFRNGLAEGMGTYTWENGNQFTGQWSKGLKEGKGTMIFKLASGKDSTVVGFWKKDIYSGKREHPWTIHFKSRLIGEIDVEYKKDGFNQVTFFITNTSGGAESLSNDAMPRMKVTEVRALTGFAGRLSWNDNHSKKTESILMDVQFPARLKVMIGQEELDIEFHEACTYKLNISINN